MRAPLLLALVLTAAPALADAPRFLHRDAACKPVAKVQFLDCQVFFEYSCPAVEGIDGPLWREEIFGPDGLAEVSTSTENGVVVEDFATDGSYLATSDQKTNRGPTLAEVLSAGKGSFRQELSLVVNGKPGKGRLQLEIASADRSVTLGGQVAQVFQGAQVSDLPEPAGRVQSTFLAYIFPDLQMVISGERLSGTNYRPDEAPHRPMGLSLPGAEEFVNTTPAFCGGKSS